MSAANELHRVRTDLGHTDVGDALDQVTKLLGLENADPPLTVRRVAISGDDLDAIVDIGLSNDRTMHFQSVEKMANVRTLRLAIANAAGYKPKLTADDVLDVVVALRKAAVRVQTHTVNDLTLDWCNGCLQLAHTRELDMSDQADRWDAFGDLHALDQARLEGARTILVLVDRDGTRYLRTSYFFAYVRNRDRIGEPEIARRVVHVGWQKRGNLGRIKATHPALHGQLVWPFFVIPHDWDSGVPVSPGVGYVHARDLARKADTSRHRTPARTHG